MGDLFVGPVLHPDVGVFLCSGNVDEGGKENGHPTETVNALSRAVPTASVVASAKVTMRLNCKENTECEHREARRVLSSAPDASHAK